MKYIRVETVNLSDNRPLGGFLAGTLTLLSLKLGVSPDCSDEMWEYALTKADDGGAWEIWYILTDCLESMPQPEIYVNDKKNHYCLFKEDVFCGKYEWNLSIVSDYLNEETNGKLAFVERGFEIDNNEILYEDEYQIVISMNTYEARKTDYCVRM